MTYFVSLKFNRSKNINLIFAHKLQSALEILTGTILH